MILSRSEERRVGKSVDLGGRRIIKKTFFQAEDGIRDMSPGDWSSDVCSSDLDESFVFGMDRLYPAEGLGITDRQSAVVGALRHDPERDCGVVRQNPAVADGHIFPEKVMESKEIPPADGLFLNMMTSGCHSGLDRKSVV